VTLSVKIRHGVSQHPLPPGRYRLSTDGNSRLSQRPAMAFEFRTSVPLWTELHSAAKLIKITVTPKAVYWSLSELKVDISSDSFRIFCSRGH